MMDENLGAQVQYTAAGGLTGAQAPRPLSMAGCSSIQSQAVTSVTSPPRDPIQSMNQLWTPFPAYTSFHLMCC